MFAPLAIGVINESSDFLAQRFYILFSIFACRCSVFYDVLGVPNLAIFPGEMCVSHLSHIISFLNLGN